MKKTADNPKAILAFSSGKDSAAALHAVRQSGELDLVALLTTVTDGYDRISMHGVREELLDAQAASLGMELRKVRISQKSSNEEYETNMREALRSFQAEGVETVVFGDIFLDDLKEYRESRLAEIGMQAAFPLWKQDTQTLADEFLAAGFRTIVTCVDTQQLDGGFSGREYDRGFLDDLPEGVDPCGENGEFHSFVFDGPVFEAPIAFRKGEIVLRDERFCFCDLIGDS